MAFRSWRGGWWGCLGLRGGPRHSRLEEFRVPPAPPSHAGSDRDYCLPTTANAGASRIFPSPGPKHRRCPVCGVEEAFSGSTSTNVHNGTTESGNLSSRILRACPEEEARVTMHSPDDWQQARLFALCFSLAAIRPLERVNATRPSFLDAYFLLLFNLLFVLFWVWVGANLLTTACWDAWAGFQISRG
jgi:hypothetical protein